MGSINSLPDDLMHFFQKQGFFIVSTLDEKGRPHSSCKGIVKIEKNGEIYLLDLYKGNTYKNLKRNANISITAVDEHKFRGYCLKGKARIVKEGKIKSHIIKAWEEKITTRVTSRILRNVREEQKGHPRHPEILLPKPQYLIIVKTEDIVNLTPQVLNRTE